MSKVVGTYTGRFDVYRKLCNIKIQIKVFLNRKIRLL